MNSGANIPIDTIRHLTAALNAAERAYCHIVWIISPAPAVSSKLIELLAVNLSAHSISLGLLLSQYLAPLTSQQRRIQVGTQLEKLVHPNKDRSILLDRIEVLFEPSLALNVGRQLEALSRTSKSLLVAWPGSQEGSELRYAVPGHPEYQVVSVGNQPVVQIDEDFNVVSRFSVESSASGAHEA